MFHFSKFGIFSEELKKYADQDGYVPEQNDIPEDFNFSPDNALNDSQQWKQYVQDAVYRTTLAQQKLEQWQQQAH